MWTDPYRSLSTECIVYIYLSPGIHFNVVVTWYWGNLNFLLGRSLIEKRYKGIHIYSLKYNHKANNLVPYHMTYSKCHVLNSQFLYATSIQLPQNAHDSCLLARSWRTVHQQVREVTTLNLRKKCNNTHDQRYSLTSRELLLQVSWACWLDPCGSPTCWGNWVCIYPPTGSWFQHEDELCSEWALKLLSSHVPALA